MAGAIELEILTSREVVLRAEIKDLYIPAFLGEAGVLSHHLPYLSLLKAGEMSYLDLDGNAALPLQRRRIPGSQGRPHRGDHRFF